MKTLLRRFIPASLLGLIPVFAAHHEGDKSDAKGSTEVTHCVVSGEELGFMGEPYTFNYHQEGQPDRVVTLCCEMCYDRFKNNADHYLAKLDAMASGEPETKPAEPESSAHDEQAGHGAHHP